MELEGKVLGYNKKTVLVITYTLVIVFVAFYAGAKYEKNKLVSLEQQRAAKAEQKKSSPKKSKAAVSDAPVIVDSQDKNAVVSTDTASIDGAAESGTAK